MPNVISRVSTTASRRAEPTLSVGSKGPDVVRLQRLLEQAGHSPKGADGDFGQNTKRAVQSFQKAVKLPVTGVANAATWNALERTVKAKREHAFVAGVKPTVSKFDALTKQIDSFTSDGRVTSAEKKSLLKSIDGAQATASS